MTDKGPRNTVQSRVMGFIKHASSGFGVWAPIGLDRSTGGLFVSIQDPLAPPADGVGASTGVVVTAYPSLYDGGFWYRSTLETFLANAVRVADTDSADFMNHNAKGLHAIISVTAVIPTGSITPIIQGKDPVSGNYYDILQGLPITTVSTNVIKVFPGISAIVNSSASDILPRIYRLRVTHLNGVNVTYSVGGALVI